MIEADKRSESSHEYFVFVSDIIIIESIVHCLLYVKATIFRQVSFKFSFSSSLYLCCMSLLL